MKRKEPHVDRSLEVKQPRVLLQPLTHGLLAGQPNQCIQNNDGREARSISLSSEDIEDDPQPVTQRTKIVSISQTCVSQEELYHTDDIVQNRNFRPLSFIGQGNFGSVILARKIDGRDKDRLYALKYQTIQNMLDTPHFVVNERKVLELVRGENFLVQLHYAYKTSSSLVYVMEFAAGGDLFTFLNTNDDYRDGLPLRLVRYWAAQIVCALETLHNKNIIYLDLKMENVLIDGNGDVLLADFGLARELKPPDFFANGYGGTLPYMAPEILSYLRHTHKTSGYTFSADYWSLGVLMYEMGSGMPPFAINSIDSAETAELEALVGSVNMRANDVGQAVGSGDLGDLICHLLNWNAVARPKLIDVKQHGYFRMMDWQEVRNKHYRSPWVDTNTDTSTDVVQHFDAEFTSMDIPACTTEPLVEVADIRRELFRGFNYVAPNYRRHDLLVKPVQSSTATRNTSSSSGFRSIDTVEFVSSTENDARQQQWDEFAPTEWPTAFQPLSLHQLINASLNFEQLQRNVVVESKLYYLIFPPGNQTKPTHDILGTMLGRQRNNPVEKSKKKCLAVHKRTVQRMEAERINAERHPDSRRSARLALKPPVHY